MSQIQLVVFVLCTAGGENYGIRRQGLCKIRVVGAGGRTAVTAGLDYEFFDGSGFYRIDDGICQSQYLGMGKAAENLTMFQLFGRGTAKGVFDDGGEIFLLADFSGNVAAAGISCGTGGIKPVTIAVFWRDDAV